MGDPFRILALAGAGGTVRGRKLGFQVVLNDQQQAELEHWQRSTSMPAGRVRRGKVVLLLAEGRSLKETAGQSGMTVRMARKWARRFLEEGIAGLNDRTGRGRKPLFSP